MDDYHADMLELHPADEILYISGGAKSGADAMVIEWCEDRGHPYVVVEALWDDLTTPGARAAFNRFGGAYNTRAGYDRNEEMAKIATDLIVFWDLVSRGTRDMFRLGKEYKLETNVVAIDIVRE